MTSEAVTATDDPNAHFAWLRTRMAVERTLMAWVRTSTALISFGFALVQFFAWFKRTAEAAQGLSYGPLIIGAVLSVAGLASLVISVRQYRQLIKHLWSSEYASLSGTQNVPHHTPILYLTAALMVVNVWTLWLVVRILL